MCVTAGLHGHEKIDELLNLSGASYADTAARSWLETALSGARAVAASKSQPSPVKHNAPLDTIEQTARRLNMALVELRHHSHAHYNFWRSAAFGPALADKVENRDFERILTPFHRAAKSARVSRNGRPRALRKQHILDLALGFCARFSPAKPSNDEKNFFRAFAERFFECATGLSTEGRGQGIGRQIRAALQRLPIEKARAAHLNETRIK